MEVLYGEGAVVEVVSRPGPRHEGAVGDAAGCRRGVGASGNRKPLR